MNGGCAAASTAEHGVRGSASTASHNVPLHSAEACIHGYSLVSEQKTSSGVISMSEISPVRITATYEVQCMRMCVSICAPDEGGMSEFPSHQRTLASSLWRERCAVPMALSPSLSLLGSAAGMVL